jgi:F-type H+-transporting ATPase subunit epsilon
MPIRCEIVSQDRMVFEGDADIVLAPGEAGVMGILPHHAPLLSTLRYGVLTVRYQGDEEHFTIAGGVIEVQPDLVTILADAAENVKEIDVSRAEAARRRAEEILEKGPPPDTDTYLAMEAALKRSGLRLEAARRYGRYQSPTRLPGLSEGENK